MRTTLRCVKTLYIGSSKSLLSASPRMVQTQYAMPLGIDEETALNRTNQRTVLLRTHNSLSSHDSFPLMEAAMPKSTANNHVLSTLIAKVRPSLTVCARLPWDTVDIAEVARMGGYHIHSTLEASFSFIVRAVGLYEFEAGTAFGPNHCRRPCEMDGS